MFLKDTEEIKLGIIKNYAALLQAIPENIRDQYIVLIKQLHLESHHK